VERSAIGRMTTVMRAFGDDLELTLAELAVRTGLPKSTLHRTLALMLEHGWLQRDGDSYRYGTLLFELGSRVRETSQLRGVAVPFMEELWDSTRLVVNLGVLDGTSVLYVEKIWGHAQLLTPSSAGRRFAANATALGKVMLAFSPPELVERTIGSGLRGQTPRTIVDPRVFRDELATVAARGFAVDDEEFAPGMWCCAAPVLGSARRAVGAVSVTGRLAEVNPAVIVPQVRRAAAGISRALMRPLVA
jgi:DNA-binding IclR family transcriptional regulator